MFSGKSAKFHFHYNDISWNPTFKGAVIPTINDNHLWDLRLYTLDIFAACP